VPHLTLDTLEFRSPIADFPKRDGGSIGLFLNQVWQRRLKSLWEYIQRRRRIVDVTAARAITLDDHEAILACVGTFTLTLPTDPDVGDSYYFFNNSTGVITISGTINGNAAGYQLTNRYQYAEITSLDGTVWIVTANN